MCAAAVLIGCCDTARNKRIACVGDSITEGFGLNWQSYNAYPARLDSLLGDGYDVMNFGRSATTMMKTGDFPYWTAKEFTNLMGYHPDVVIIKLGTNDCKRYNWNAEKFAASYQDMIDSLRTMNPVPEIKVCLPVPVFKEKWEMTDSVIVNGVIPAIKKVAEANSLEVIDMYSLMADRGELFFDSIHPDARGTLIMAEEIAKHIRE